MTLTSTTLVEEGSSNLGREGAMVRRDLRFGDIFVVGLLMEYNLLGGLDQLYIYPHCYSFWLFEVILFLRVASHHPLFAAIPVELIRRRGTVSGLDSVVGKALLGH